jgi:hypothetical protein
MAEEEHRAAVCAHAVNDMVDARGHGIECLAARAAVSEKAPARALHLNVDSPSALVGRRSPIP